MNALIYGQSGSGKTVNSTLVKTKSRGRNLLLCSDNSHVVLNNFERPNLDVEVIKSWSTFMKQFDSAVDTKKYDCIIVDNLTDVFDMAILELEESGKSKDNRQYYQIVYQALRRLARKAGQLDCDVIFTAWETIDDINLPTGEHIQRVRPNLSLKILDSVVGLCNVCGHVESAFDKEGNKRWYYNMNGSVAMYGKDQLYIRKTCLPENIFEKKEG